MPTTSPTPSRRSNGAKIAVLSLVVTGAVVLSLGVFRAGRDAAAALQPEAAVNVPAATGHNNLTLDETGLSADAAEGRLTFATLEQWHFTPDHPNDAPEAVRQLDGREQRLSGFMFPLESGTTLRNFCLLKTTQTCCYGPMPQFNQYVLVEMDKPVTLAATRPVTVTGKFHIDPQPEEGFIYRMEGAGLSDAPVESLRVVAQ